MNKLNKFLLASKFKNIGMLLNVLHSQVHISNLTKTVSHITRESNGFHIYSTLITIIITKIIPDGNKALSQVVDQNTRKARKVPHARG